MSTVQRPRIVLADILFSLFVFIVSISVLFAYDVGLIEFKGISSIFLHSSSPSPPPSSSPSTVLDSGYHHHGDRAALGDFKVPACVALFLLTLLAFSYTRIIYSCRLTHSYYQSFDHYVAQVRVTLLLQHNQFLANGLQKATNDPQKANANVKQEQWMKKFNREIVEGACKKFVELERASTEALRRSNDELDDSKESNTLVNNLHQDQDLSQANVRRLAHSAKEHEGDMNAADRNRLKAIAEARHAQAEANALHSEAASALDAMRVEIDLVRRDLGASKRRAKAARDEARTSHMENIYLRSALAESRKEISTVRKGAKDALETLMAELKEQRANNKKPNRLLATSTGHHLSPPYSSRFCYAPAGGKVHHVF